MELTGKLKNQVEHTENMTEKRRLIEKAGMKLTDEELEMVSGGKTNVLDLSDDTDYIPEKCPVNRTGKHTFVLEPNSLFEETCIFCGCKRPASNSLSNPDMPTRT